jgi:hypothetical protein
MVYLVDTQFPVCVFDIISIFNQLVVKPTVCLQSHIFAWDPKEGENLKYTHSEHADFVIDGLCSSITHLKYNFCQRPTTVNSTLLF